jgi:hypothetical protein
MGDEVLPLSLDDHLLDIDGFSQIRDDDTEFNQFPQVLGENIEIITQFWRNPLISLASEVAATCSHVPPTMEQALDNVPSIVADIVWVALDSMQPPKYHRTKHRSLTQIHSMRKVITSTFLGCNFS